MVLKRTSQPKLAISCQTCAAMAASVQQRDDVQPVANETLDRFLTGAITVIPVLALGLVAWQLWNKLLVQTAQLQQTGLPPT